MMTEVTDYVCEKFETQMICPKCNGKGCSVTITDRNTKEIWRCDYCQGKGEVQAEVKTRPNE